MEETMKCVRQVLEWYDSQNMCAQEQGMKEIGYMKHGLEL